MMDSVCRVDCTKCRNGLACCRTQNASIDLTLGDVFRISEFLKLSPAEFVKEFVVLQPFFDPQVLIRELPLCRVSADLVSPCSFLVDGVCRIQEVKPLTCLCFPGNVINKGNVSEYWRHFFPCVKEYSQVFFPYVGELERLYEVEGMNLVERLLGFGLFGDCLEEAKLLVEEEKEIYSRNIPVVERDDLFMTALRGLLVPRINKEGCYQKVVSGESFDSEVCLDVKVELVKKLVGDLDSLRESVKESSREYYRIREEYGI